MKIFHGIDEYRSSSCYQTEKTRSTVTLGKFDGVHIGHRKLIKDITNQALRKGFSSVVFAIEMPGGSVLSHEERALYLESLGVDILIECPFSKEFMSMSPEEFVREVLSDTLRTAYVCVGHDFAFGHERKGDPAALRELGDRYGFQTMVLKKERRRGEDVSSTRVRGALEKGDMPLVQELLGRPYPILGTVRHGRHIGTGIGFPTVNLIPEEGKVLPPDGVYASVTVLPGGTSRKGLTNVGMQPTVGGNRRRVETTLFDFHDDLYGKQIRHELLRFIRPVTKFSGLDELKAQIQKDRTDAWGEPEGSKSPG